MKTPKICNKLTSPRRLRYYITSRNAKYVRLFIVSLCTTNNVVTIRFTLCKETHRNKSSAFAFGPCNPHDMVLSWYVLVQQRVYQRSVRAGDRLAANTLRNFAVMRCSVYSIAVSLS